MQNCTYDNQKAEYRITRFSKVGLNQDSYNVCACCFNDEKKAILRNPDLYLVKDADKKVVEVVE